jgi:hypothetical protein
LGQAIKIPENEVVLQAIRTRQIAAVERLLESYARPFGKRDAKGKLMAAD